VKPCAQPNRAKLLLQVHDELVVEAPEAETEPVATLVKESMEGAAALRVPLVAPSESRQLAGRQGRLSSCRAAGLRSTCDGGCAG